MSNKLILIDINIINYSPNAGELFVYAKTQTTFFFKNNLGVEQPLINIDGLPGETTETIRAGTTFPSNALGSDGDFYFNVSNGEFFKKEVLVWNSKGYLSNPISSPQDVLITGPQGPSGPAGAQGPAGQDATRKPMSEVLIISEDFIANTAAGNNGWTAAASGTGATATLSVVGFQNNRAGLLQLFTGTTAAGRYILYLGTQNLLFGQGKLEVEMSIYIPILSDSVDRYTMRLGLGDSITNVDHTDGAYFEYDLSISPNWILKTANNNIRTSTISSVPILDSQWIKLKIEAAEDGSSISYYINGNLAGTIITNIATSTSRLFAPSIAIIKNLGIVSRSFVIDYYELKENFNPVR